MKTIFCRYFLFIILNILTSVAMFSQPYRSIFGNQTTQWNQFTYNLSSWTCSLNTLNDTIINSKNYKKIGYSGIDCFTSGISFVFVREDTNTGKAWVYNSYNNYERLFMDLSLNVGDTFRIYPNSPYYDTIVMVDSVYFENNLKKIRLNIDTYFPGNEKLTFIEGVGTNIGIDYPVSSYFLNYDGSIYLLCYYKDNVLEYMNTYIDTCNINIVGLKENVKKNDIEVFPNPVNKYINIKLPFSVQGSICIYDLLGRTILNFSVKENNNNLMIDVSQWANGFYIIQYIDESKVTNASFNKFLKK